MAAKTDIMGSPAVLSGLIMGLNEKGVAIQAYWETQGVRPTKGLLYHTGGFSLHLIGDRYKSHLLMTRKEGLFLVGNDTGMIETSRANPLLSCGNFSSEVLKQEGAGTKNNDKFVPTIAGMYSTVAKYGARFGFSVARQSPYDKGGLDICSFTPKRVSPGRGYCLVSGPENQVNIPGMPIPLFLKGTANQIADELIGQYLSSRWTYLAVREIWDEDELYWAIREQVYPEAA